MQFVIDSSAVVKHTATLERISKSALPVAIRQTLNAAAFDVKKNTMPDSAKRFTQRNPTFFKSASKVNPAAGFQIDSMRAIVGFAPQGGVKESGHATQDLEQQESGGDIQKRAFIPTKKARTGSSWNRPVSGKHRLAAIKAKIIDSKDSGATTDTGKYLSSAKHAGKGGFVIGNKLNSKGNKMLMRINSVKRIDGNTVVNATPIYSVKGHRSVHVKKTGFMREASVISANKMDGFFIMNAEKQIEKVRVK